ncbi:unnamed protein product [Ixodes hexagonus]
MLNALSSLVAAASTGLQQIGSVAATVSSVNSSPASSNIAEDNLKGVQLPRYTLNDVCQHCHHNDCWLVIHNRVYDVTSFLRQLHPGINNCKYLHYVTTKFLTEINENKQNTLIQICMRLCFVMSSLFQEEHMNIFNDVYMQVALTANS